MALVDYIKRRVRESALVCWSFGLILTSFKLELIVISILFFTALSLFNDDCGSNGNNKKNEDSD